MREYFSLGGILSVYASRSYKAVPERPSLVNHCQKFGARLREALRKPVVEDACGGLKRSVFVLQVRKRNRARAKLRQTEMMSG